MRVAQLRIENFRGIRKATLDLAGHTLFVGENNVGKSTVCEALDLLLGPDRLNRPPVVQEHDFYNAHYLDEQGAPKPIIIEAVLIGLSPELERKCAVNTEYWNSAERRLLSQGELEQVDAPNVMRCLRLQAFIKYDEEEDDFVGSTYFAHSPDASDGGLTKVPYPLKRSFGFLYLRALRTGSRALSLERGSLLDIILRMNNVRTGLWEATRKRLRDLDPPIDESAKELQRVLESIESRISEYVSLQRQERSTRLFVSQLTRQHLRRTLAFFLSMSPQQEPVPFQQVGTGTLNILVLALLTFIADAKPDDVIFAMEEPETALPPHTQRRIAKYLLTNCSQCFVTSHSPYVIECFAPEQIMLLSRNADGEAQGKSMTLPNGMRMTTYRAQLRRAIAEAVLGQGVVVCEGISEMRALKVVAQKMEDADPGLFPLDVAGVCIVSNDGDGNLSALGGFFKSLELQTFAFFDKRKRANEEVKAIQDSYDVVKESPYKGLETLLANEVSLDHQWDFLAEVRAEDAERQFNIPEDRPRKDEDLRELMIRILKGLKGEGGAARLLDRCAVSELPNTLQELLKEVYVRFPMPTRRNEEMTAQVAGVPPATRSAEE